MSGAMMEGAQQEDISSEPLDLATLLKAADMMTLMPDGVSVHIQGLNKTYLLDELMPGIIGLEDTLGKDVLFFTVIGYIIVSVIGAVGNALVLFAILTRPKMRVVRHVFIANLAFSDFILCAVTTPFTLMEVMGNPIGTVGFMCKAIPALQATSVYVSTLSITAIALERYKVIVYSVNPNPSRRVIIAMTVMLIWFISLALSMPFIIFRISVAYGIPNIRVTYKCTEDWPVPYGRALYSVFCMFLQYCMPSVIIGAAHVRIVRKLKRRFINRQDPDEPVRNGNSSMGEDSEVMEILRGRRKRQHRRQQKINLLLFLIAIIFALCWLPLNVLNIVADFSANSYSEYRAAFDMMFVLTHLFAMSSAVANPILYGLLNENFRHEFREVFLFWVRNICCGKTFGMERQGSVLGGSKPTEIALSTRNAAEVTAL